MPSIICRSTAGSLRPLPAICSASKIAGYKNVRFVPRSTCGFTLASLQDMVFGSLQQVAVLLTLTLEDSIPKVQTILKTSRLIGTEFGAKWGKLALNSVPNL